jgi:tetratricopeptide (TPR) repeat protein
MGQEKTCFISMPFGQKPDLLTGRVFDFNRTYGQLVKPAAEEAGYTTIRADELRGGTILRPLLERIITCDVFIADMTTTNPNVMYELGIRHALSDGATLLLMESSSRQLPFDLAYSRVITYKVDPSGSLDQEYLPAARQMLTQAISQGIGRAGSDSPIYGALPDLRVDLPDEIVKGRRRSRAVPRQVFQSDAQGVESSIVSLKQAEEKIKSSPDVDAASVIDVMKGYQVNSAWQDLVQFASALPEDMKQVPQVAQMTALALNRLGRQQEAIALLRSLTDRTGGDSETYGILARIYKGLYSSENNSQYLQASIDSYRLAYTMAPNDYYAGLNLVSLLALYGGDEARSELNLLVPKLRGQLAQRVEDPRADFWDLTSALELAVVARDWPAANGLLARVLSGSTAEWMLATTMHQLQLYSSSMDEADRSQLQGLLAAM